MANSSGIGSKRPHSEVEDADDFVPISKRINNINLQGPRNSQDEICFEEEVPQPYVGVLSSHHFGRFGPPENHMMALPEPPPAWSGWPGLRSMPMDNATLRYYPANLPIAQVHRIPCHNQVIAHSSSQNPDQSQVLDLSNPRVLDLRKYPNGCSSRHNAEVLDLRTRQPYCPEFHNIHPLPPSPPMSSTPPLNDLPYVPHLHFQTPASATERLLQSPRSDVATLGEEMMGVDGDYDPELGETDNPHYYHINRVLFQAHCERTRREGDPLDLEESF